MSNYEKSGLCTIMNEECHVHDCKSCPVANQFEEAMAEAEFNPDCF